jgi:hypothetical protein
MKTESCIFNGKVVSVTISNETKMMVNATEMAKIFDADVFGFLRIDSTEKFVKELSKVENSRFENEFTPNGKFVKVIRGGRHSGTWMDRRVALKFAAWLDPAFEVWFFSKVDEILFEWRDKREQSLERSLRLQKEAEILVCKAMSNESTGVDFGRYLAINNKLKEERLLRRSLTNGVISDLKMELEFN